ncbi:MAG: NAD(P)-dependent oxidoreductase [Hyphococcus sp.]|nr:MAG: NAD(P)-dependent oxidoreductase [Marinicaulis sp.]
MRTLLFGRNGQVASALIDEAYKNNVSDSFHLIALGSKETDLLQHGAAADAIQHHQPDFVINATAYTAVDKAENEREAARQLNETAPFEMAQAAKTIGAKFIHLSTDYVFDGKQLAPYSENDTVNPLNIYGRTKLAGERAVMEADSSAIILRTSWVFSEFSRNFVKTMLSLAETRNDLNIVDDQIGGPTSARDIASAILTIVSKVKNGASGRGVYHYQGAPSVSWADFARSIFEASKLDVKITGIPTCAYPTPAQRPQNTILNCARIAHDFGLPQPDWRIRLDQTVKALKTSTI